MCLIALVSAPWPSPQEVGEPSAHPTPLLHPHCLDSLPDIRLPSLVPTPGHHLSPSLPAGARNAWVLSDEAELTPWTKACRSGEHFNEGHWPKGYERADTPFISDFRAPKPGSTRECLRLLVLVNCVTCDQKGFTQKGDLTEYILTHTFDYFGGEVYDSPPPPQLACSRKLKGTMNSLQGDGMLFFDGVLCPTLEIRTREPGASSLMKHNSECIEQGTKRGNLITVRHCYLLLIISKGHKLTPSWIL